MYIKDEKKIRKKCIYDIRFCMTSHRLWLSQVTPWIAITHIPRIIYINTLLHQVHCRFYAHCNERYYHPNNKIVLILYFTENGWSFQWMRIDNNKILLCISVGMPANSCQHSLHAWAQSTANTVSMRERMFTISCQQSLHACAHI